MKINKLKLIFFLCSLIFLSINFLLGQVKFTAESLIEKNIESVGGKEKLRNIRNFSFRAGTYTYYVLSDGTMKVLIGMKPPVVIASILIHKEFVKENLFNQIQTIKGNEKSRLLCLATLISGLFSLDRFQGTFIYEGIKKYGPEKHHIISTKVLELNVTFSLDAETYLVRGMNIKTYSDAGGHYEFSYEFGSPKECMGFKIPSTIFVVPVGTQSSISQSPQQITNVQFNQNLDDRFFSNLEVNIGEVAVYKNLIKGNVLDILLLSPRPSFVVVTNWRKEDIEKAGFQKNDKLILSLDGIKSELTLTMPETDTGQINSAFTPDARIMAMEPARGPLYYMYFNLKDEKEKERLLNKLKVLLPIQVRKK